MMDKWLAIYQLIPPSAAITKSWPKNRVVFIDLLNVRKCTRSSAAASQNRENERFQPDPHQIERVAVSGCDKPGRVLFRNHEWMSYQSGVRTFAGRHNFTKIRVE